MNNITLPNGATIKIIPEEFSKTMQEDYPIFFINKYKIDLWWFYEFYTNYVYICPSKDITLTLGGIKFDHDNLELLYNYLTIQERDIYIKKQNPDRSLFVKGIFV